MCTFYKQDRGKAERWFRKKNTRGKAEPAGMESVRPTHLAPVVTSSRLLEDMSWGFRRRFKLASGKPSAWKPVVNSRDDKLASPIWREAFAERRCIVPVSEFYEWSGPAGAKTTHRFRHPQEELLWVAGVWEPSAEFGNCYSMITTLPNREVGRVHDRMLVVLMPDEIDRYLDGGDFKDFHRPDGILEVASGVPNPLQRTQPPSQGELF
ncbi:SOS response-associated peptidase [Luteolibacter marinus]|uniref:SOS response-associated peptidase n=1 Tax=Luteolibacter marinus TaxID=2776705 RepID=UPI00186720BB|nr:SOS response-associated peptidase family protein [Luteolibacter marinus]